MTHPNRPIRIMRLVTRLNISGPTMQAMLLTAYMNDDGHESLLVGGAPVDEADSIMGVAAQYDVKPHILEHISPTNPVAWWRAGRELLALMREYKPDVVHTHAATVGFLGRIAARIARVPVVVHTLHVHPFRGYYNKIQSFGFITVERIGAYLSDSIITLSEKLRRELTERYHITRRNRVIVLPLGFDLSAFSSTARHSGDVRQRFGIPPEAPLVGVIGRLLPVKHYDLFLEAAARIHRQMPEVCFLIVGDGPERASLEQQARELKIDHVVAFTGWLDDMPHVYAALDVLASSSLNEGTPVPIIEALAAGCRVVATDVGGVRDVLNNGALGQLVPPDDADALAGAILNAISQPYDATLARETMERWHGIDRLVSDLDSLYRGLLSMKKVSLNGEGK